MPGLSQELVMIRSSGLGFWLSWEFSNFNYCTMPILRMELNELCDED